MDLVKGLHVQINPEIIKKSIEHGSKLPTIKASIYCQLFAVSDVIRFAFCQLGSQWRVHHKSEQT
jgi:hypothetical protein